MLGADERLVAADGTRSRPSAPSSPRPSAGPDGGRRRRPRLERIRQVPGVRLRSVAQQQLRRRHGRSAHIYLEVANTSTEDTFGPATTGVTVTGPNLGNRQRREPQWRVGHRRRRVLRGHRRRGRQWPPRRRVHRGRHRAGCRRPHGRSQPDHRRTAHDLRPRQGLEGELEPVSSAFFTRLTPSGRSPRALP